MRERITQKVERRTRNPQPAHGRSSLSIPKSEIRNPKCLIPPSLRCAACPERGMAESNGSAFALFPSFSATSARLGVAAVGEAGRSPHVKKGALWAALKVAWATRPGELCRLPSRLFPRFPPFSAFSAISALKPPGNFRRQASTAGMS